MINVDLLYFFFFQAEDGIRDLYVTGVQTCALPILAERWDLRPPGSNPCRGVDRYPEKRRERFLSAAELARLGAVLEEEEPHDPFVVLAIRLLLLTGARRD